MSAADRRRADRRQPHPPAHVCAIVLVDVAELHDAAALVEAARSIGTTAALEAALDVAGGLVRVLLERSDGPGGERVPCPPA